MNDEIMTWWPDIYHTIKVLFLYLWTIMSWTIGMMGIVDGLKLYFLATKGKINEVNKNDGMTMTIEYGSISKKDIISSSINIAILIAWWYMILRG